MNPFGWPQLVIYCTGTDVFGREKIYAFGCVHVPTEPGKQVRYARMFCPVGNSIFSGFYGWLTGKSADYIDAPKIIASAEGREVTKVKAGGIIKIEFQVTQRNLNKFGYIPKPQPAFA
jgi:hypothetical protein